MNRRQILSALVGSIATVAAGELLIPSRKIFLPPRCGWDLDCYQSNYSLRPTTVESVWTFEEPPPAGSLVQLTFGEGTISAYVDGKLVPFGKVDRLEVTPDFLGAFLTYGN